VHEVRLLLGLSKALSSGSLVLFAAFLIAVLLKLALSLLICNTLCLGLLVRGSLRIGLGLFLCCNLGFLAFD